MALCQTEVHKEYNCLFYKGQSNLAPGVTTLDKYIPIVL